MTEALCDIHKAMPQNDFFKRLRVMFAIVVLLRKALLENTGVPFPSSSLRALLVPHRQERSTSRFQNTPDLTEHPLIVRKILQQTDRDQAIKRLLPEGQQKGICLYHLGGMTFPDGLVRQRDHFMAEVHPNCEKALRAQFLKKCSRTAPQIQ